MRAPVAVFLACAVLLLGSVAAGEDFQRMEIPQPDIGEEFPDFTLPGVDGREVSLSDFRGKVIILSFWSCYTDTCFTSVRVLEDLIRDFADRGLVAPTICSEIPPALEKDGYAELIKRCGAGQTILIDAEKKVKGRFHVRKVPTTFLIGRDYLVRQKLVGVPPLMSEDFSRSVRALVEE